MSDDHETKCPLGAVERRLEDAHRQWHQAQNGYFEPETFRLNIQSAIQTLRTVTFILQNRKREIPDFDCWYGGWQESLRENALMRWMVDARNKIEKQGDLEMYSFVRAEILASYLEEEVTGFEVKADLFDGPRELIASIPDNDLGEHVWKHGILKIQRRWVENTLPDHELLDAVAIAYGHISELVSDAHRQMGLPIPVTTDTETGQQFVEGSRRGRLPCMIAHGEARALTVSLSDGRIFDLGPDHITVDRAAAEKVAKKYDFSPRDIFPKLGAGEEEVLTSLFDTARKVIVKDGYHETIVFFLVNGATIHMMTLRPEDHGHKYIMMRHVADEVSKVGADAVIVLSEIWKARFDPTKPYQRAVDAPDRSEYVTATLVTKTGSTKELVAEIMRDGDVMTGETEELPDPVLFSFAPVLRAWGLQIPVAWLDYMDKAGKSDGVG